MSWTVVGVDSRCDPKLAYTECFTVEEALARGSRVLEAAARLLFEANDLALFLSERTGSWHIAK